MGPWVNWFLVIVGIVCVIVELALGAMTGFDLAQRLLDRDPHVNVLFTSGHIPAGFIPADFAGRNFDLVARCPFGSECRIVRKSPHFRDLHGPAWIANVEDINPTTLINHHKQSRIA